MSTVRVGTQVLSSKRPGYQNSSSSDGTQYWKADFLKSLFSLTYKHEVIFLIIIPHGNQAVVNYADVCRVALTASWQDSLSLQLLSVITTRSFQVFRIWSYSFNEIPPPPQVRVPFAPSNTGCSF